MRKKRRIKLACFLSALAIFNSTSAAEGFEETVIEPETLISEVGSLSYGLTSDTSEIADFIPGDLNSDFKVNTADVVLCKKYLAGDSAISVNLDAADVNADGNCDDADLDLLRKYIVGGYNVELKKSTENTYNITYHLYDGDTYLESLDIENKNPATYRGGQTVKLDDLKVDGCIFEGWYDSEKSSALPVTEISADDRGDKELYARWSFREYTVQFVSELYPVPSITYTTNKGAAIGTNPTLPGYIFTGWTDEKNNIVTQIKKGTIGNITLYANWTSRRNQVRPVNSLANPVIYYDEELNCIQFAYEIGTIENVPLYEIEYLGNKANGITYSKTTTTSKAVNQSTANTIAETVASATTQSDTWTLSKDWNVSVTDSSTHESESGGSTTDESESGSSGETGSEHTSGGSGSDSVTGGMSVSAKIGAGSEVLGLNAELGGEMHAEATAQRTWNSENGYKRTNKTTANEKHIKTLNSKIVDSSTHSFSRSDGGSESQSIATATTHSDSRECASSFTYSTQAAETSTIQYSNENAPEGYYRVVCAGTLVVYAVVNYDITSKSYGVFTYSLLEDETKDFLDYSKVSSKFDDNMNGVLPFEVPIFVNNYVDSVVGGAEKNGFVIDIDTGKVVDYFGTQADLIVPEYITADNGDGTTSVVKVTGIESGAFAGKNITSIQLCDTITSIPDNAFKDCTVLQTVKAPGVTKIGNGAFAGCTSLKTYTVSNSVTSLGDYVFDGLENLTVNAANIEVAQAAIASGAKDVTLTVSSLGESLNNVIFEVPDHIETFTISGDGGTYTDLRVISNANETVINRLNITGSAPALKTSSKKVTLNRVSMESAGLAVILSAENTELLLNGTIQAKSGGDNTVLCKSVSMNRLNASIVGKLNCTGNVMTCGIVNDKGYLTFVSGEIVEISKSQFDSLLNDTWSEWSEWSSTPITGSINVEVESKTQYQYSDKQTTTSTNSSLAGWTQTGSTTQYGDWGGWSSWGRDYVAGSDTREVQSTTVYGYYYYRCPNCGAHMHGYPSCFTWANGCGANVISAANAVSIFDPTPHSSAGLYEFHGTGKYATDSFPQYGRLFKWTDNGVASWTGYQYRDRSKTVIYSYDRWGAWSAWGDTVYAASSTRQVQTRTLYRYRTRI